MPWLQAGDVAGWLGLVVPPGGVLDPLVGRCAEAVEPQIERARPDQFVGDPAVFDPDAEVYQAGVMLAARLYRRRNSPGGIESFVDSIAYVSKYDPEIERALRVGPWRRPVAR